MVNNMEKVYIDLRMEKKKKVYGIKGKKYSGFSDK